MIVKLLVTFTTIALMTTQAWALSCRQLHKPAKTGQTQLLLEVGEWLQKNAGSIDPKTTHLEKLVPVANGLVLRAKKFLTKKAQEEELFANRKQYFEMVFSEVESRIATERITYEYLSFLTIRLSVLMDPHVAIGATPTGPTVGTQIRPADKFGNQQFWNKWQTAAWVEDAKVVMAFESYVSHESFLEMKDTSNRNLDSFFEGRYSAPKLLSGFQRIADNIARFQTQIYLPIYGGTSFASMNRLFAKQIYPIGILENSFYGILDRQYFSPHDHAYHDRQHGEDHARGNNPAQHLIENKALEKVEQFTGWDFETMHMMHFMYFHEGGGVPNLASLNTGKKFVATWPLILGDPPSLYRKYFRDSFEISDSDISVWTDSQRARYSRLLGKVVEENKDEILRLMKSEKPAQ